MKRVTAQTVRFHAPLRDVQVRLSAAVADQRAGEHKVTSSAAPPTPAATSQVVSLLTNIAEKLEELKAAQKQNLSELQEVSIELSVAIAAHLLKTELDAHQFQVEELVRDAVDRLRPEGKFIVKVSQADFEQLKKLPAAVFAGAGGMDLSADPKLSRGACYVGSEDSGLLSSFEGRLENIRETLLGGIDYARTERRKPVGVDGGLRRFPDRRKPA